MPPSGVPRGFGVSTLPPPPPELPKFWRSWAEIPSSVENNIINTGFTHLQIEWNPRLRGYCPHIPVLSSLCSQLNLLNTSPSPEKIPAYATGVHLVGLVIESTIYYQDVRNHEHWNPKCVCYRLSAPTELFDPFSSQMKGADSALETLCFNNILLLFLLGDDC
jgi:hypothetical protein